MTLISVSALARSEHDGSEPPPYPALLHKQSNSLYEMVYEKEDGQTPSPRLLRSCKTVVLLDQIRAYLMSSKYPCGLLFATQRPLDA